MVSQSVLLYFYRWKRGVVDVLPSPYRQVIFLDRKAKIPYTFP